MARHLVLTGFMGAGKSTAAERIAPIVGLPPVDIDARIERRTSRKITDLFATDGEPAFRALEAEETLTALAAPKPSVIALGGGAIENERIRAALAGHLTVYLEIDADLAWARAAESSRPLAASRDDFEALLERRRPLYESVAGAILPANHPGAVPRAAEWVRLVLARPPGVELLWGVAPSGDYPVLIEPGMLGAGIGAVEDLWPLAAAAPGGAVAVTDANVAAVLPWLSEAVVIEPGEAHKNLAAVERVCGEFAARRVTRAQSVLAVGGGVVGDTAGFCAAIYQRGMPVIQVPTTVVAQVDSAYGGKTGVDLPAAKNYVGAYHQPAAVLVDPDVLAGLPVAERAAGYAEIVKTALIAGGELWRLVADGDPAAVATDRAVIRRCAHTKLSVVASDERDDGRRQVLNLGHTIGHAIEAATGYGALRHGEAVALGMLGALRLSGDTVLRDQVADLWAAAGLPATVGADRPGVSVDAIVERVTLDKKRVGDRVPFVLVGAGGPGDVTQGHEIAEADLRLAVEELIA